VPALELHVDLLPAVLHLVPQRYESVVLDYHPQHKNHYENDKAKKQSHDNLLSGIYTQDKHRKFRWGSQLECIEIFG